MNKTRKTFTVWTSKIMMTIAILLTTVITFNFMPLTVQAATNPRNYVALGDSVPYGYGLANPETGSYTALFYRQLKILGYVDDFYNLSVNGFTTTDLLYSMRSDDSQVPLTLSKAEVITLNIGGNNILGPMIDIVNDALNDLGISDVSQATPAQLTQLTTQLPRFTLNADQLATLQEGVDVFSYEFPQIIDEIKRAAPNAKLIVSTIYNPIPSYFALSSDADALISAMNDVIWAGKKNYRVADTYAVFKSVGSLVVTNFAPPVSFDIHPNALGHSMMAFIHFKIFLKDLIPSFY